MNPNFPLVFTSILLEATPFMLLGSALGGLLEEFVSRERLLSLLPKKALPATALAASAGILIPTCECAVVPIVRRLAGKGLPLNACVAYLLAAPIVNPLVAASTFMAYRQDWRIAALRLVFGYFIALVAGLALGRLFKGKEALLAPEGAGRRKHSCACGHCHDHDEHGHDDGKASPLGPRLVKALRHGAEDFLAIAPYFVAGALAAAFATTCVERKAFLSLASFPFADAGLMALLAFLLNLCSQADAFVAASFGGLVSPPAQMAFLLLGPILDVKLLLMYKTLFTTKAIVHIALLSLGLVAAATALMALFAGVQP